MKPLKFLIAVLIAALACTSCKYEKVDADPCPAGCPVPQSPAWPPPPSSVDR